MYLEPHPLRIQFPVSEEMVYFNHAGVAPIPVCAAEKVADLALRMARLGAWQYMDMEALYQEARNQCAALIGAMPHDIAFVPNTSQGLSLIALGLDWQAGDEVITTDQEFPSNLLVWLDLVRRLGIVVHRVPSLAQGRVSADALLARVGPRTRVVTVSSVQYATGAAVDLSQLGEALKNTQTLLVVDGIQSLGVLPMEVKTWGVDALTADGHKWLLSPEGYGLFYLSEKAMAQVSPRILGWHSVQNAGNYDRLETTWREGIRRFEAGSPNLLAGVALGEGVRLLREVGIPQVKARIRGLMAQIMAGLADLGCRILTPLDQEALPAAGILVFSHPGVETAALSHHLRQARIHHATRGGGIRFSPHFYQDGSDVDKALAAVAEAIKGRGEPQAGFS